MLMEISTTGGGDMDILKVAQAGWCPIAFFRGRLIRWEKCEPRKHGGCTR